jgi:hypothetical protein
MFLFLKKGRKAYLKENKDATISKANNDKYYLPKGEYTVRIGEVSSVLEVK